MAATRRPRGTRDGTGPTDPVTPAPVAAPRTPVARRADLAVGPYPIPDRFPRRVRTTIRPDQTMVIGRNEWIDLTRAGLVIEDEDAEYTGVIPVALHPRTTETKE